MSVSYATLEFGARLGKAHACKEQKKRFSNLERVVEKKKGTGSIRGSEDEYRFRWDDSSNHHDLRESVLTSGLLPP